MSSEYTLQKATEADSQFLFELMKQTMQDHIVATWGEWDEDFQVAYFQKKFDPEKNTIIVVDGEDVGGYMVTEDAEMVKLDRLFLLPEYQGQGIGSQIVKNILKEVTVKGKKLTLTVIKHNARVLPFYERLGLQVVSENEERFVLSS